MARRASVTIRHDERESASVAPGGGPPVRTELHLPLVQGERHVGVISLARVRDRPFEPSEVSMFEALASQTAIALSNARALQVARHQARINRAVLETANEAFVAIDEAGVVTAWNSTAEKLFGWPAREAIGRTVAELIVPARDRRRHWDGLSRFLRSGEGPMVGRPAEVTAVDASGRELPVELTISPINLDGRWVFNAFVRDITARRRAQLYLQTQNAVARVLAEAATAESALPRLIAALAESLGWQLGAYWSVDADAGRLRMEACWAAPGLDAGRWIDASAEVVFHSGDGLPGRAWETGEVTWVHDGASELTPPRAKVAASLGLHAGVAMPIRSGTTTIGVLELLATAIDKEDDQLVALMSYLGQQIGQYLERKASEREAELLKDQFFALVSHELRTPLTSIIGYLELVMEDRSDLDETQERFLTVVERNARRLLRLVGDLLFVAHVEAGRLALEIGEVDLASLTGEAVEAARPRAESREIELTVDARPVAALAGDRDRLAQVLDNLVSNAVKFTPEHGHVAVRLAEREGEALLEVQDTGVGIPAAEQPRLFERFYRASSATERAIPGVGLGLTIAKAIVEAHGGRLSFESVEGAGTTFAVCLPLRPPPAPGPPGERVVNRRVSL
jgi:PAS domain S-box-containing protein